MNLRKAMVRSGRKVFNGSKVEPVFNSRSMVLEGDLKLGRTMGLLTPKIFYSGWLKSDHPVISIQRLGSPAESPAPWLTTVITWAWQLVNFPCGSLKFVSSLQPHFRIHLVHLTFIRALSLVSSVLTLNAELYDHFNHWMTHFGYATMNN